jgi:hypothetical protein
MFKTYFIASVKVYSAFAAFLLFMFICTLASEDQRTYTKCWTGGKSFEYCRLMMYGR